MPGARDIEQPRGTGALRALLRDKRGNALVLGAAAMFPLAGIVGAGVDMGRLYMAKTRLQHACDAGALAGRRTMGGGGWAFQGYKARTAAEEYFAANWPADAYGSGNLAINYTESQGVVTGDASVTMPMTIMRIFDVADKVVAVRCNAEMRLLNTDVMFVLDTTGSMDSTIPGDTVKKIDALRASVKCFYQILAQLDIVNQDCVGDEPSGGVGSDVQLRFGFVPYSVNVNVGRLLPTSYFPDNWTYNSRTYLGRWEWADWRYQKLTWRNSSGGCTPDSNTSNFQYRAFERSGSGFNWCEHELRERGPLWRYEPRSIPISQLKNGTAWRSGLTMPNFSTPSAANEFIAWDGCVEERQTVHATSYDPRPTNAKDLDIDLPPSSGDSSTLWKPILPNASFYRGVTDSDYSKARTDHPIETANKYLRGSNNYSCPTESRKLRSYQDSGGPANFAAYVDDLTPTGQTYHDIGMIWGQRLLSPSGFLATENAATPSGGAIERHLIFMTDGDTQTNAFGYGAYGIPWYDRRHTTPGATPTDGETNTQVNKRFEALCERGKKHFTIWVIGFGSLTTDTKTRLENCASPGRYFLANNGVALQQTFRDIAEQIGQLRLRN